MDSPLQPSERRSISVVTPVYNGEGLSLSCVGVWTKCCHESPCSMRSFWLTMAAGIISAQ